MVSSASARNASSHDELLASGIKAIANKGIDRITVGDITKISHHSRPTFYTYFGDMNGFLAELWIHYGIEWLDSLVENSTDAMPISELNSAMLEVLLVSHRNAEIAEVLNPDIQNWWQSKTANDPVKCVRLAWYLSVKLGTYLSIPIIPDAVAATPFLAFLRTMPDDILKHPGMQVLVDNPMPPQGELPGIEKAPEHVERQFLASTIEVVANSGVAATSMARIARRTRVSTGTLYPRYKTTDAIIAASFDLAIRQIVDGNVKQLEQELGPEQYGSIVVAGFLESRKSWRNYRLEMYLESQHNPELAKHMFPGLEETRLILDGVLIEYGYSLGQRAALTQVMQNLAVGISMLFNAGIPVDKLDHRIPPRYISVMAPK